VLESSKLTPKQERSSRKEPFSDEDVKALLKGVREVRIARGRKVVVQPAKESSPDDLKGPTGNYRAPILQIGKTLLVGFNQDALEELVSS